MKRKSKHLCAMILSAAMLISVFAVPTGVQAASTRKTIGNFVERLYNCTLERASDADGKIRWMTQLKNGVSAMQIAQGFVFSKEFQNAGLSNYEYVHRLYHLFLDRDPEYGGFNNWVKLLDQGASRLDVFGGIAGSVEFKRMAEEIGANPGSLSETVPDYPAMQKRTQIWNAYMKVLGRVPSASEIAAGVNTMKKGTSLMSVYRNILNSREHYSQVVTNFYREVLEREPEAAGLKGWVDAMAKGMKIEEIEASFWGSKEYQNMYPSHVEFVKALYSEYLGREATDAEAEKWAQQIAAGKHTRFSLYMQIACSIEGKAKYTKDCYADYLEREARNDEAMYWAQKANSRTEIYNNVRYSLEYIGKTMPYEKQDPPFCTDRLDTTSDDNDDPTHTHEWVTKQFQVGQEWKQTGTKKVSEVKQGTWVGMYAEQCTRCGAWLGVSSLPYLTYEQCREQHGNGAKDRYGDTKFVPTVDELNRLFPHMVIRNMSSVPSDKKMLYDYREFGEVWTEEARQALNERYGPQNGSYWMGDHESAECSSNWLNHDIHFGYLHEPGDETIYEEQQYTVEHDEPVYGWVPVYEDREVCNVCGDKR